MKDSNIMNRNEFRKYIDLVVEAEQLDEGMMQKFAKMALTAALSLGSTFAKADTIYSYLPVDSVVMKTTLDKNDIPTDARVAFEIDTDTKDVVVLKGQFKGQTIPTDSSSQEKSDIPKTVERSGNSLVLTGFSLDEVKEHFLNVLYKTYPDAQIDDNNKSISITRYSVQGTGVMNTVLTALMAGGMGSMDVTTRYNFNTSEGKITVNFSQFMMIKNAMGRTETHNNPNLKGMVDNWAKDFEKKIKP